jgi:hypothetical protein
MPFMLGKSRGVARPIPQKPHPGPWPITDTTTQDVEVESSDEVQEDGEPKPGKGDTRVLKVNVPTQSVNRWGQILAFAKEKLGATKDSQAVLLMAEDWMYRFSRDEAALKAKKGEDNNA